VRQGWFKTGTKLGADGLVIGASAPDFSDSERRKAQVLFGRDHSALQGAMTYEVTKANDDFALQQTIDSANNLIDHNSALAPFGDFVWTGVGYNVQSIRRELRHSNRRGDLNYREFTKDVSNTVGNYTAANTRTSTIRALRESHAVAEASLIRNATTNAQGVRVDAFGKAVTAERAQKSGGILATIASDRAAATGKDATSILAKYNADVGKMNVLDAQETMTNVLASATGLDTALYRGDFGSQAQSGGPGLVNNEIRTLIDETGVGKNGPRPSAPPPTP
jgi:hypothetical protein